MRYAGNKAVTRYRGNYRPVNRYHGAQKVAGWKEQEQSGAIPAFEDTYNDKFQSMRIHGATAQSGSGDPSPSNIRPFTVIQPQRVNVSGKNLSPINTAAVSGTSHSDGAIASAIGSVLAKDIPVIPAQYTVSLKKSTGSSGLAVFAYTGSLANTTHNGAYVEIVSSGRGVQFTSAQNTLTFAVPAQYNRLCITSGSRPTVPGSSLFNISFYEIQLELGAAAQAYTPYTGQSYPIAIEPLWGGDWYDAVTGEEHREKRYAKFDGGEDEIYEAEWGAGSTYKYFQFIIRTPFSVAGSLSEKKVYCETFLPGTRAEDNAGLQHRECVFVTNNAYNGFRLTISKERLAFDEAWTNAQRVSALRAWLVVNPITVLCELAVPAVVQHTPIQIGTYPKHTVISAEGAQVTARCRVVDR